MSTAPEITSEIAGLAYYIRHTLYDQWQSDRKPLEAKWQRNLNAFKAISDGFWKTEEAEGWRSDTFIQITRIKILSAWAMIMDLMLRGGKLPFKLEPSPEMKVRMEDMDPSLKERIEDAISDMTGLIHQQMADCKADRQLLKCGKAAAIYGETYGKRFVHGVEKKRYRQTGRGPVQLFEKDVRRVSSPGWEYTSVWDLFRDLETDDLQDSAGVIHRQLISPYQLRVKSRQPLFDKAAISRAIATAARNTDGQQLGSTDTSSLRPGLREISHRRRTIEYLEFWGRIPRVVVEDYLENEGGSPTVLHESEYEWDGDELECHVCLAGDEVVRFVVVEPGQRPFMRVVWEDALDENFGLGVADSLQDVQVVLNGLVRAFEDNKKLSGNVMMAIKKQFLGRWDGVLKPGAQIDVAEEVDDVRKALQPINVPDIGASLLDGIGLFERYGDESSQLPKILQGAVHDKQKPDTATEINRLNENAGKYLGAVIRNFDEGLIEPVIEAFYDYNMEDPDCSAAKGDWSVQATGFIGFQDRIERTQKLMAFLNLILVSEALLGEVRLRAIVEEVAKSLDLDPETLLKTPEERQAEKQQAAQMEQMIEALEMALKQAQAAKLEAEARLAMAKAGSEAVDQAVKQAGVGFDERKMRLETAKTAAELEKASLEPFVQGQKIKDLPSMVPEARQRGTEPYRERGLVSNNQH